MPYLALFAIVFGINLLPAFGPPTWAILVFTRLHWHLNPIALVLIGAVAATCGRYLLALGARHFSGRLPQRMQTNLTDAKDLLGKNPKSSLAVFAVFVVSPLPSAQLFLAAGFGCKLRMLGKAAYLIGYALTALASGNRGQLAILREAALGARYALTALATCFGRESAVLRETPFLVGHCLTAHAGNLALPIGVHGGKTTV